MFCPYCGKEINDDAVFCKYCGKNVKDDNSDKKTMSKSDDILGIISIVIVVICIIAGIIFSTYNHFNPTPQVNEDNYRQEPRPELEVINPHFCWSLSPKAICGTVVNNGIRSREDFRIKINLYDSQNQQIGDIDTITRSCFGASFDRCFKWNFKIPISNPNVERFEIDHVSW